MYIERGKAQTIPQIGVSPPSHRAGTYVTGYVKTKNLAQNIFKRDLCSKLIRSF